MKLNDQPSKPVAAKGGTDPECTVENKDHGAISGLTIDKRTFLFLLLVPIVIIVSYSYLDSARGPYFYAHNSDPEYAYLLNSLNIAELKSPSHIDHPGTPLQVLGGLCIGIANIGNPGDITQQNVINESEYYLYLLNMLLAAVIAGAALLVGIFAFEISGKLYLGLLLQVSLFCSPHIYHELVRVRPETLLISITYLFLIPVIATLKFRAEDHLKKYLAAFALLTGLGIATKIVFVPLAIIPLILIPRFKNKILFVLFTILSFLFFTIPIWPKFSGFFSWCYRLLTRSGRYGGGEADFVDTSKFFDNIFAALTENPVFSLALLLSVVFLVRSLMRSRGEERVHAHIDLRVLMSLIVAQFLQVLLVSKHYSPHYLLPALMLTGITMFCLGRNVCSLGDLGKRKQPVVLLVAAVGVGFVVYTWNGIGRMASGLRVRSEESLAVVEAMNRYPEHDKVYYYRSSSKMFALHFGNSFAGSEYGAKLNSMFPGHYFYNVWSRAYSDFSRNIVMEQYIKDNPERLKAGNPKSFKVVFQGRSFERSRNANQGHKPELDLIDVHEGPEETIYLLNLK